MVIDENVPQYLTSFVAIAVTLVWCITFLADIFNSNFQPDSKVHFAFLGVLGGIFGFQFVRGKE